MSRIQPTAYSSSQISFQNVEKSNKTLRLFTQNFYVFDSSKAEMIFVKESRPTLRLKKSLPFTIELCPNHPQIAKLHYEYYFQVFVVIELLTVETIQFVLVKQIRNRLVGDSRQASSSVEKYLSLY